ncbi:MAG: recombinase family protein, partial [Burkholderiales bacterium]|nr:recombinase family protein [Burkholderiales bacterium]
KLAIYVRANTAQQSEDGVSIESQVNRLAAWAQREGHEVVEVYSELASSGTDDRNSIKGASA